MNLILTGIGKLATNWGDTGSFANWKHFTVLCIAAAKKLCKLVDHDCFPLDFDIGRVYEDTNYNEDTGEP